MTERALWRSIRGVAALFAAGILAAACSSSPRTTAGTTSTTAADQAGTTSTTAPASTCSQQGESGVACVSRITAQGTMTAPVQATNAIALVGPDPAIIETNADFTALSLIRLG